MLCCHLLCYEHFVHDEECKNHLLEEIPEDFVVEGSRREFEFSKRKRKNQQKETKLVRNSGRWSTQHRSFNLVASKTIRSRCDGEFCKNFRKECIMFSEEDRRMLFDAYYGMKNLLQQREYIVRHVKKKKKIAAQQKKNTQEDNTPYYIIPYLSMAILCLFVNSFSSILWECLKRSCVLQLKSLMILELLSQNEEEEGMQQ